MKALLTKVGLPLAAVFLCGWSVMLLATTVPAYMKKREQRQAVQAENDQLRKEVIRKRQFKSDLETSQAAIELEIRSTLKLNKHNETSYILPADQSPASATKKK